jgi:hypothetical protein
MIAGFGNLSKVRLFSRSITSILSRLWIFAVLYTPKIPIIGILRTFGSMAVCAARNRLTGDFLEFYARSATNC